MALLTQTLQVWASETTTDGVTGIEQKKTLTDNEWLSGWTRQQVVSAQQLNTIFNLVTSYALPSPVAPCLWPEDVDIPDIAIVFDGSTITEDTYPNLYSIYGATLPDMSDILDGYIWIARAQ